MSETRSLSPSFDPSDLFAESAWVRRLARRLVTDEALADDLVQDTWVEALARRPEGGRSLRGWLATVMRHRLAKLRRGDRHRRGREEGASRGECLPSTLDVVERASTHRDLVETLMNLEEPYRRTLLLRFFDQRSYGEIAAELGISEATVNSRVTRGLERLRRRLERGHGDRRALALALIPLAAPPSGPAVLPLSKGAPMQVALAAAGTLVAAVTATVAFQPNEPTEPARVGAVPAGPALAAVAPEPGFELLVPASVTAPAERVLGTVPASGPQERRRVEQEERPAWEARFERQITLGAEVTAIQASVNSGDLEVVTAAGGSLFLEVHVKADGKRAKQRTWSERFEDHLRVVEEKGALKIEEVENRRGLSTSLVVHVPLDVKATLNTGSGNIRVAHAEGPVLANTGSGDVHVDLPMAVPQKLTLNTGSGDVTVEAQRVEATVVANTGSGDLLGRVHTSGSGGKLVLNTGSGDAVLFVPPSVSGKVKLSTSGDEIKLPAELGITVEELEDGKLRAEADLGPGATYAANSGSGDVSLRFLGTGEPLPKR